MDAAQQVGPGRRVLISAFLGMFVAACGGGGGSTSIIVGPIGGGPPDQWPPPMPDIGYVGQTGQAQLTAENAEAYADTLLAGVAQLLEISDWILDSPVPAGLIDQQLTSGGGRAILRGNISADGRGWISAEYEDYPVDGQVLNGVEVQTISEPITAGSGAVRIDLIDFHVQSAQRSYQVRGSLSKRLDGNQEGRIDLQGDLMFLESGQAPLRAGPYGISMQPATGAPAGLEIVALELSGRTYVPSAGYLHVQTREAFHYEGARVLPGDTPFSGELTFLGTQGSRLGMAALNRHFGALVIERAPPNSPGQLHKRFDWDPAASVMPGGGELMFAGAGPDRFARLQQQVTLDGRFAVHRHGLYLQHRWRMIAAPPGASASITGADQPVASIVAHRFGTYLVEHEVSDGQSSATDLVRIIVADDAIAPEGYDLAVDAGPDLHMRSGDSVLLDGRRTVTPFGRPVGRPAWVEFMAGAIGRPSARHLVLEGGDSLLPRVSTDVPGYYEISHTGETFSPPAFGGDIQVLYVDYPWRLYKPAYIFSSSGHPLVPEDFLAEDVTGNGVVDLVASVRGNELGEHQLVMFNSFGGGQLNQPVVREYSISETVDTLVTPVLAAGPPNIDGARDILVTHGDHIRVFELQSDWSIQEGASIATGLQHGVPVAGGLKFVDFSGASAPGLVRVTGSSQGGVEVFLRGADQGLEAPIFIGMPDIVAVAFGDFGNDGQTDLVVVTRAAGELPMLSVGYGDGAGGFDFDAPRPWPSEHVAVGDVNGDGRDDIVGVASDSELVVLFQQGDGGLEAGVIAVSGLPIGSPLDLVDFDGDGLSDIVSYRTSLTTLVRQTAPGVFAPAVELGVTPGGGRLGLQRRAWVDFDGDGRMDLVAVDRAGNRDVSGFRGARGLSIVLQAPAAHD